MKDIAGLKQVTGRGANAVPDRVVKRAGGSLKVVESKYGSSTPTPAQRDLKRQLGDDMVIDRTTIDDVSKVGGYVGGVVGGSAGAASR